MRTRDRICEREAEVRRLVRWNVDAPALRLHAASCGACREALAVAAGMQELARQPIGTSSLLSPTTLWWKAQILRRWDAQREAATRMELGDRMQVGIGLVAATVLLVWLLRQTLGTPAGLPAALTVVMLASAVLLVTTALIVVRELLAWERLP